MNDNEFDEMCAKLEDDDIDRLITNIEHDLFVPQPEIEHMIEFLPVELRDKIEYFYNWNMGLIPELRYRMKQAFADMKQPAHPWQHWILNYLCTRIEVWLFYNEHPSERGIGPEMIELEGTRILSDIRNHPELKALGDAYERVLDYNKKIE